MRLQILGKFYDNHSLSIVNRNIATNIAKHLPDIDLSIIALDTYNPEFNLDKKVVKSLKSLETVDMPEPEIQLRHTYPPIWKWPENEKTKVVFIQPWEYPKVPFEWQYKFETFAAGLVVPSNYVADVFLQGGINPNKVDVVPNGYDDDIFNLSDPDAATMKKFGIDKDKFNYVYVGNSQWRKGLEILLNVWPKLFKRSDNARLIIKDNSAVYGPSNILSEIIRMQYHTNCAEIIYIDENLKDKEMADLFKASKAVVHPYRAEGFGMHIQEAMACGCVPIVSEKGSTDDFVDDEVGLKVKTTTRAIDIADPNIFALKPGDATTLMSSHTFINEPIPQDLADKIVYLYQSHDREKYFNAVENTDKLSTWEDVAKSYVNTLSKYLETGETT